jgi:lipid II:glycine glycyltransferase (peptidoglycan interpeptide bridge formation enzyme)
MIVVETVRSLFRVVEVYYPRLDETQGLADNLALTDIVYMRQMPVCLPQASASAKYVPFETNLIDLRRDESSLLSDMNRTCRHQVRKVDHFSNRVEVRRNDQAAYRDLLEIYNSFAALKRHSEKLSARRLAAFKPVSDVFVAYLDGRPICGHLLLRDEKLKRVGALLTASTRLNRHDPAILVSSLNRWLHWYEMKLFKTEGMHVYDFCG